jgi:hypothetical protein
MTANTKGIIAVLITAGVVYLAYKKFVKPTAKTDIEIIIERLDADYGQTPKHETFVKSADSDYIKAWANAIRSGSQTFMSAGKTYNTKGGTASK